MINYKEKLNTLLEVVKGCTNILYGVDIRKIVSDFEFFYKFNQACQRLGVASDSDLLTDLERDICIGYLDNAANVYSHIYRDFKEKYNRQGQNLYHTEEENFNTALKFAELVKDAYDFDLIEYLAKKDSEEEKRAASLIETGESFSFDGFLTDEEKMLLCE